MYVPRKHVGGGGLGKTKSGDQSLTTPAQSKQPSKSLHDLESYLSRNDFTGAQTLLQLYQREAIDAIILPSLSNGSEEKDIDRSPRQLLSRTQETTWWMAYCHFQTGEYEMALGYFDQLLDSAVDAAPSWIDTWRLSRACCLYYLQDFEGAEREALLSTRSTLCNRLLYLVAHRRLPGAEMVLLERYKKLSLSDIHDQLAMAFTSFLGRNYQEAVDVYKRLVLNHKDKTAALHLYLAMCYFHLDYYDVSLELLAVYLEAHRDSFTAANLKASNQFKRYSGVEGGQELDAFHQRNPRHPSTQDTAEQPHGARAVMLHNQAIFDDAARPNPKAKALLSRLVNEIDSAKMNLALACLQRREYQQAFELLEDLDEPTTAVEHITKAILHATIGEQTNSKEHIFLAEKFFHAIGSSTTECDTIPGRQCMASYFLLRKEFTDANVYLSSIASYLVSDDAFNWNYGMALVAVEQYAEAEEVLLRVQGEKLRSDLLYCSWLARAYIHSGKNAALAWELYLGMENTADALKLLKQIANDYYKAKNFYFAVKAFDVLERLDPDPEYWEAKRGACVGFFQQVALGAEAGAAHRCEEVLKLLMSSKNVVESNRLGTMLTKWVHSLKLR